MSCELDVSLMDLTLAELQMVHYLLHLPVCEAWWGEAAQRNLGYITLQALDFSLVQAQISPN